MADELYLLKVHGNHSGQHSEVGMYFHGFNLTANDTFENAKDLVLSWQSNCLNDWCGMLPASYEVDRLSARRVQPAGGVEFNQEFQDAFAAGTLGAAAASNQLCPLVRLIPPMGVVSAGKFFLPCIAESEINANTPSAGWIAALATYMGDIFSNFGTGSIGWINAVYSTKLQTYADTVTFDTSSTIGWQKRRAKPY
jgi:hypothetical protein